MRIVRKLKGAGLVRETDDYDVPQGVVFVPVDLKTGYRAIPSCGKPVLMAFLKGTEPTELCGDRPHTVSNLPGYLQKALYVPRAGEPKGERVELPGLPPPAPGQLPPPGKASAEGGPPG
jgi:hypothetical protein